MNKPLYYKREFINLPGFESTGSIFVNIELEDWRDESEVDIDFELTDCSRKVSLYFNISDENHYYNSLYKAELLRDTLDEFVIELNKARQLLRIANLKKKETMETLLTQGNDVY